jgi:hypothetical protein
LALGHAAIKGESILSRHIYNMSLIMLIGAILNIDSVGLISPAHVQVSGVQVAESISIMSACTYKKIILGNALFT